MSFGTVVVPLSVAESAATIGMSIAADDVTLRVGLETAIETVEGQTYEGPYSVTPSQQAQTLATEGHLMTGNVVVNPIPSNYGKITWNGAVLTVS